jgi:enoyl-CoA hydratase/carnithine racemase
MLQPNALKWVYSGEILSVDKALEGGLVDSVVPSEDLLERAYEMARMCSHGRSPASTALMRQMMYRNSGLPHPLHAHMVESLAMLHVSTRDGKEGVDAFLSKRAAQFTDKASAVEPMMRSWWKK